MANLACMIDLETLSLKQNAYILSIGACVSDLDAEKFTISNTFYERITIQDYQQEGRDVNMDTLRFHLSQISETFKENFLEMPRTSLDTVLIKFRHFCEARFDGNRIESYWSKGVDFDIMIMEHAMREKKEPIPWSYRQRRCFRTLEALANEIIMNEEQDTEKEFHTEKVAGYSHTALIDCTEQMRVLFNVHKWLEKAKLDHLTVKEVEDNTHAIETIEEQSQ